MRSEKDDPLTGYQELYHLRNYFIWENSEAGKIIYVSVLIFIFCLIISLIFIKVDISVKAPGIIRPVCEKTEITSLRSGRIEEIYCREGDNVGKGQLLLTLESMQILDELEYYRYENSLISSEITDLTNLLAGRETEMASVRYRFEKISYTDQVARVKEQLQKARKEKDRLNQLFRDKLISDKEYDDLSYAQSQVEKEINSIVSSALNRWQTELSRLKYQAGHTKSEISRVENELSQCRIIAPVSGQVDQLAGIYIGSVIQAGQILGVITPDTSIISDVYVTPENIGLLKSGQEVILIIDAFDYRDWGVIHAHITSIPDDFILVNNQPVFRIRCKPEQDFICLKNGVKGQLKKGMTLTARCIVTSSTVAHLIAGRLDRILNPAAGREPSSSRGPASGREPSSAK
jgi:HlyD family secretion protein